MQRLTILKITAAILPLLGSAISATAEVTPTAETLLRGMTNAEKTLSYSGTFVVSRPGTPTKTIQMWRSGEKRRLEWVSPPVSRGDLLVDDGQSVWHYFQKDNTAVQTRGATEIDWQRLSQNMIAKVEGSSNVAGRAAWIVEFVPKNGKMPEVKVWIDQKTMARLRVERGNSATKSIMALQKVNFGAVPASRFQWSPPASAVITRTNGTLYNDWAQANRAASWLSSPANVPAGYAFESAVVDAAGNAGKGEAWLRYANGLNRFSVFQQRTDDNRPFPAQKTKSGGWFVQKGGNRYVVLGLADSKAKSVAESLK